MHNNEYQPLMLSTQELLMAYWPQVEPLLAKSPVAEEHSPEAIRQAVLQNRMFIFVFKKETPTGPEVELVLLLALVPSETLPVMTIVTVAGKNLRKLGKEFWQHFIGWCRMSGIRAIDAYVPEHMEQFIKKEFGLTRESIHVRLRL